MEGLNRSDSTQWDSLQLHQLLGDCNRDAQTCKNVGNCLMPCTFVVVTKKVEFQKDYRKDEVEYIYG